MILTYTLDENNEPVPCEDSLEWARWMKDNHERRKVARSHVDGHVVSTIFLGMDHAFLEPSEPILYETMVFRAGDDGEVDSFMDQAMERYRTREEAVVGHRRMCQRIQEGKLVHTDGQ